MFFFTFFKEDVCPLEGERAAKTKRKKKKKSKPVCKGVQQETHNIVLKQHEPPKFEVSNLTTLICI